MVTEVIHAENLHKYFPVPRGFLGRRTVQLKAVDGVSLTIGPGETLGLVGESGCGKSTVGNLILGLLALTGGRVLFQGQDLAGMSGSEFRRVRSKLQVVFQDPQSSLDPRMTVRRILGHPLRLNRLVPRSQVQDRVLSIMAEVGLTEDHLDRYPHELSGGQKQRVGVARALITEPEFIVFDEPTSALDISVQAQILNLITDLQRRRGYAYLFISHDLSVVRHVSRRIAVMYLGAVVESAPKSALFKQTAHPYTRALLAAAPKPDPEVAQQLTVIRGEPASPINIPLGCRFQARCPEVMAVCRKIEPPPREIGGGHWTICHLYG
jgi:peptide/nickel transport system ATP-binding protein/oligopeptide transport system ATP-binding protein